MNIIFYIFSVILSVTIDVTNKLRTIKILANKGYKCSNIELFNSKNNLLFIIDFIPVVNLVKSFIETNNVNKIEKSEDEIFKFKNIDPLTVEERKLYKQNKNLITALYINIEKKILPNMILVYMEEKKENIIYFLREDNIDIITSSTGPVSKLPKNEQYKALKKQMDEIKYNNITYSETKRRNDEINNLKSLKNSFLIDNNMNNKSKNKVYTLYKK